LDVGRPSLKARQIVKRRFLVWALARRPRGVFPNKRAKDLNDCCSVSVRVASNAFQRIDAAETHVNGWTAELVDGACEPLCDLPLLGLWKLLPGMASAVLRLMASNLQLFSSDADLSQGDRRTDSCTYENQEGSQRLQ
jgi:hypothetical protein